MNVKPGNLRSPVFNLWSNLRAYKAPGRLGLHRRDAIHASLDTNLFSTIVVSALQIHLFMQNKANLRKSQLNVSVLFISEYMEMDTWFRGKNKAKTNPIEANSNPIIAKICKNKQKKPISSAKIHQR